MGTPYLRDTIITLENISINIYTCLKGVRFYGKIIERI